MNKKSDNTSLHKVHVKYCGLKTVDDILCASECNIDYIGLMFYKKSSRFLSIQQAKSVLEQAKKQRKGIFFPKVVGVFVDSHFDEIQTAIAYLNLDIVQLYSGYIEYAQYTCPYWSSIRVKEHNDIVALETILYEKDKEENRGVNTVSDIQHNKGSLTAMSAQQILHSNALIIDSYSATAYGGTGEAFNWDVLKNTAISIPYFIAGGIREENVKEVLMHAPYGIDISSGIEKTPGVKDHTLMRNIANIVQQYNISVMK